MTAIKIAFFDAKPYDQESFDSIKDSFGIENKLVIFKKIIYIKFNRLIF